MKSPTTSEPENILARPLAPEDIQRGQYVAILEEIQELHSFLWNKCGSPLPPHELIRLRTKPARTGSLLKVKNLGRPLVHVQLPVRISRIIYLTKFHWCCRPKDLQKVW